MSLGSSVFGCGHWDGWQNGGGTDLRRQLTMVKMGKEWRKGGSVIGSGKGQREGISWRIGRRCYGHVGLSHLDFGRPLLRIKPESRGGRMKRGTAKLPISGTGYRHAREASATFAGMTVAGRALSKGRQLKCDCPVRPKGLLDPSCGCFLYSLKGCDLTLWISASNDRTITVGLWITVRARHHTPLPFTANTGTGEWVAV